jgi:hypothetical protein
MESRGIMKKFQGTTGGTTPVLEIAPVMEEF